MKIYLKKVPWGRTCKNCYFSRLGHCEKPVDIQCWNVKPHQEYKFVQVPKKEYNKHIATKNKS
jgi:hypothetical protein